MSKRLEAGICMYGGLCGKVNRLVRLTKKMRLGGMVDTVKSVKP